LAEIVRRVSGKTIDEYSRTNIFEPLGMKDTSYGLSDAISGRRVVPDPEIYRGIQGYDPNDPVRLALPHGGGGVFSTIDDLAIFVQTFLSGGRYAGVDLLSPASGGGDDDKSDSGSRDQRSIWHVGPRGFVGLGLDGSRCRQVEAVARELTTRWQFLSPRSKWCGDLG
jgi:CubicO group peptidase (beta-lactamase class C family)